MLCVRGYLCSRGRIPPGSRPAGDCSVPRVFRLSSTVCGQSEFAGARLQPVVCCKFLKPCYRVLLRIPGVQSDISASCAFLARLLATLLDEVAAVEAALFASGQQDVSGSRDSRITSFLSQGKWDLSLKICAKWYIAKYEYG